MPTEIPAVLFVEDQHWEAFLAMAAALRLRGYQVKHVVGKPRTVRERFAEGMSRPVFGPPIRIVDTRDGERPTIDQDELAHLMTPNVVDLQAHDDLVTAANPGSGKAIVHRVGKGVDERVLTDKWRLADFLQSHAIPTPKVWRTPTADTFPVVVKDPVGFAGDGVFIVSDMDELTLAWDHLIARGRDPFVQEFCGTNLQMSGGVALDGDLIVSGTYQPVSNPADPSAPAIGLRMNAHPAVAELTALLVKELGFTGMFNADWIIDREGNAFLIDFNPRIFGTWPAMEAAGVPIIDGYLHSLGLGARPELGTINCIDEFGVLCMPFAAGDRKQTRTERDRQRLVVKQWTPFLGKRWARVAKARISLEVAKARMFSDKQAAIVSEQ